ncbi:MAG TPA: hypothetical protein VGF94_14140 [Kofleriaceae bacterium]
MVGRFVICVALAAGACGDRGASELARVRDAVCACKTPSCADDAMKTVPQRDVPSNARTQKIAREMLECVARLHEQGRPTADPDAEADRR